MNKRKKRNRIISFLLAFLLVLKDGSVLNAAAAAFSDVALSGMEISGGEDGSTPSGISDPNLSEGEADHAGAEQEEGTEPEMPEGAHAGEEQEEGEEPEMSEAEADYAGAEQEDGEEPEMSEAEADYAGAEQEDGEEPEMSEASEADRTQSGEGEEISAEPILRDSTAGKNLAVSGSDLPVSDNALREPEDFHETPAPEAYGELASYDAYSRTYRTGDNSFVTVIGTDGATYLDEAGRLRQIDNTLTENPVRPILSIGDGASYVNSENNFTVSFNETVTVSGGNLLTVTDGEHALSIAPVEGNFADGVVKYNAIRYNNVLRNVDFQYTVVGNTVKEDIILLKRGAQNSFSYALNPYGLETTLLNNTLFVHEPVKDPEKEAVFVLEAPEMKDALGELSFQVKLTKQDAQEGVLVTVTADEEWLLAPERLYPVRIDPTVIQVPKSAIHVACAEEGSPNTVIGDNAYPYVGYDNGITSENLAGFGSKHLNCRSYFQIDYDFGALAAKPEIVKASFQVTQKTHWSKGKSEFGLFGVEEPWETRRLNWNNQLGCSHYFLDSQTAVTKSGQALSYDVTEEVGAWIHNESKPHGFVMKAMVEAPSEAAGDADMSMQCEALYNNSSASYAPKLIVSWTGELTELDRLAVDEYGRQNNMTKETDVLGNS